MKIKKQDNSPVPNGILLVVGGHENKDGNAEKKVQEGDCNPREVLETFIRLTGKKSPVIEVVTSASAEGEASFKDYETAFFELGVKHVGHIHHAKRADAIGSDWLDRISSADAVFLSGGDQLKLTSIYGGTPFLIRIKERYMYDSLVLGGTSAGAMAMSTSMIFAGSKSVQQIAGEVRVTTGFGFLKNACIDTHFVDRGRFVRMAQVIAMNPTGIGLGIEEDTALIIRNGNETEVIGSGIVIVIEGFHITDSNIVQIGSDEKISIQNLNVKLLSKGNRYTISEFDPQTLKV
jgi:cyanophycinase